MDPFLRRFGEWSDEREAYILPRHLQSLMNSLPLIGKLLGTVIVGPIIERFGHRWTMAFTCSVQVVGPISEFLFPRMTFQKLANPLQVQVTSRTAAQFTAGRFLVYTAVGLVENVRAPSPTKLMLSDA